MAAGAATLHRRVAHRSGTTWRGFHVLVEDYNDGTEAWVPRDLTDATCACQFRDASGALVIDMELGNPLKPGLAVNYPTTGGVAVQGPGVVTANPGILSFDLKLALASGLVVVDLDGTQEVIAAVTVPVTA